MCHQHAVAGDAQAEGHIPEVRHILGCEMLQVPAVLGLHSNREALSTFSMSAQLMLTYGCPPCATMKDILLVLLHYQCSLMAKPREDAK